MFDDSVIFDLFLSDIAINFDHFDSSGLLSIFIVVSFNDSGLFWLLFFFRVMAGDSLIVGTLLRSLWIFTEISDFFNDEEGDTVVDVETHFSKVFANFSFSILIFFYFYDFELHILSIKRNYIIT